MQAFAASLDVTFLASPARVEAFVALFGREGAELCEFILGKVAAGDVFPVVDRADELDIYAEAAVGGEGEEREAARVRDVEVHGRFSGGRRRGALRQPGLTALSVVKCDFFGRRGEILAEEFAEDGAGRDVGVAIAMESEAVGAGVFVRGEIGFPGDWWQALRIVGEAPDVDLARCQVRERLWRARPVGGGGHGGILCQVGLGWGNGGVTG